MAACLWPLVGHAATVTQTLPFTFNHAGAVDSGLISVLGTFTTTATATSPSMTFQKFDASLGTLSRVDVVVTTGTSSYAVGLSGLLSLISSASVSRTLSFSVVSGTATATATDSVTTSGAGLLTLLGGGPAQIGGAVMNRTVSFTSAPELTAFSGNGAVMASLQSTDVLTASTLLSVANGAGFYGTGTYAGTVRVVYTYDAGTPVSGRVFTDDGRTAGTANDGALNGGEPGAAGRTVQLLNASNAVIASTVTATDGSYRVVAPPAITTGTVLRVRVASAQGMLATGATPGSCGGTHDRDTDTLTWTLTAGTACTGRDFGTLPLPSLSAPSRQFAAPGTVVFYRHRFAAPSLGQVTFSASHTPASPAGGWTTTVHVDTNANGVLEPTELPVTGPVPVTTGQVLNLIVRVFVPPSAPFNTRVASTIRATMAYTNASPALSADGTVQDLTDVGTNPAGTLVLLKTVDAETVLPGGNIVYAITFTNRGTLPLGQIVVSDATPAYTRFVSATVVSAPAGLGTAVTSAPAVGATGPLTWQFPGQLASQASGVVTFTVRVDP